MQKNEKYQVLATKVSAHAWQRINRIARKKGLTIYELVQMVCDTLIRYMDDCHNLTREMEQVMAIFEHLEGWREALNLADPSSDFIVGEAIYFLFQRDGRKKGCRAVHITKPFFGDWKEDVNIQHILERTIELLMPERYRRLRLLAVENDCASRLELFDHLIDLHANDSDIRALREEFEDANRSEYGAKPNTDGPYRRRHQQTIDMFEAQYERQQYRQCGDAEKSQWLSEHSDELLFENENYEVKSEQTK